MQKLLIIVFLFLSVSAAEALAQRFIGYHQTQWPRQMREAVEEALK